MQSRNNDILRAIGYVFGLLAALAFAYALRGAFVVFAVSMLFYFLLEPVSTWFEGRTFFKRVTLTRLPSVIIAFLAGIMVVTILVTLLIPPVVDQVERFTKNLPEYTTQAEKTFVSIEHKFQRLQIPAVIQDSLRGSLEKLVSESTVVFRHAAQTTAHFFSQILMLFMIPFLTFYLLLERDNVKAVIVRVFPRRYQQDVAVIMRQSSAALRGYITGQSILCVIMGVCMTIGLRIIGVKAALLLGILAGITQLIPVVGVIIGCVPAAFVALSTSLSLAITVVILFSVIQLLENKVILPLFLSRYVGLSPLSILVAILIGEQLGGVPGMFLATPIAAVFRVVYINLRAKYE